MKRTSIWKKVIENEAFLIVLAAVAIAVGLYSFEMATGLPASIRGAPTYNVLETPELYRAAPTSSPRTRSIVDRLRERREQARQDRAARR